MRMRLAIMVSVTGALALKAVLTWPLIANGSDLLRGLVLFDGPALTGLLVLELDRVLQD